jgi:hypothetical protein
MAKWMVGVVVVFVVVYGATVTVTGNPQFLIPVLILAALLAGYALFNKALTRRIERRDGSLEEAMSDNTDPVPASHLVRDDETPAGDTPEAHDEISPHDLPVGHPGRQAAEEEAQVNAARGGTDETRGDADLGTADDRTAEERARREGRFEHDGGPQAESAPADATQTPRGPRSAA